MELGSLQTCFEESCFFAGRGTEGNAKHLPKGDSSHLRLQGGSAGEHISGKVKPGLSICEE